MLNITNFTVLNLTEDGRKLILNLTFSDPELVSKYWADVRKNLNHIFRANATG